MFFMHDMHKLSVDVKFTQMTAKKVIKKHGERAVEAMHKEYTKLEDMKVMRELNLDSLTISQKKGALRAINLIKEKWSGKLRGRTCVYGRPQRCYTTKEDASLPKISLEAFCTSLIFDAD